MELILNVIEEKEQLSEIELKNIEYINKNGEKQYEEIIKQDPTIENLEIFSKIPQNIINWYPFKENCTILEVNANLGEVTKTLCLKAKKVVCIEKSKQKAIAISKRFETQENLKIIQGNLQNIKLDEKFDYIFIHNIEKNDTTLEEYINLAQNVSWQDATILLAINNQFGVSNLNGIDLNNEMQRNNMSKKEIENILKQKGYENYKYYYPLPNYKLPNIIYTDKHLPTLESINRDLTLYPKSYIKISKERDFYKNIIKKDIGLFTTLATSFLIEISKIPNENKIELISFGNSRKPNYRMKTIMLEEEVHKQNLEQIGQEHIDIIKQNIEILNKSNIKTLDTYDNEKIISRVIKQPKTFDKYMLKLYQENNMEEFYQKTREFFDNLKKKLEKSEQIDTTVFEKYGIQIDKSIKQKLHFIKYGMFDLIFQNSFFVENDYYFYDQEWIEENLPLEFIIFRAIFYLTPNRENIKLNEIYKELEIIEYIEMFEKLEQKLQEKIKDDLIWKIHSENSETVKTINDTMIHYRNLHAEVQTELERQIQNNAEIQKQKDKKIEELTRLYKYYTKLKKLESHKTF